MRDLLSHLALTDVELRTYSHLLSKGHSGPSDVARSTRQSRGRVYETLKRLVEHGLARQEALQPVRYMPVPLAEVLSLGLLEAQRKASALQQALGHLPGPASAPTPSKAVSPSDVSIVTDRRALRTELHRAFLRPTQSMMIQAGGNAARRLAASPELLADLSQACARGTHVEVQIPYCAPPDAARERIQGQLGADRVRLVQAIGLPAALVVRTEEYVLIAIAQPDDDDPDHGHDITVRLGHPSFADAVGPGASPHPSPQKSVLSEPTSGLRLFARALEQATSEVMGMAPPGWSALVTDGDALARLFATAKARGIRFRGITVTSAKDDPMLQTIGDAWQVRRAAAVPACMAIIDGKVLFQGYPDAADAGFRGRVSHDAFDVAVYRDLFERLWADAETAEEKKAGSTPIMGSRPPLDGEGSRREVSSAPRASPAKPTRGQR